jgi:hypothetical protein
MRQRPQRLTDFIFARIVEESGGYDPEDPRIVTGEAMAAYLDWVFAVPSQMTFDRYARETAVRWNDHADYKFEWAPRRRSSPRSGT